MRKKYNKFSRLIKRLGPGLITGAADDDPSGIATYMQTGAQFGYSQLWSALFMYPFMTAVQEACARIGAVSGKGLAQVIKEHYNQKILYFAVSLLLIANIINLGADIGAMAAAARLIIPLDFTFLAVFFTITIIALELYTPYKLYSKILKWLTLSLIAYPIIAFISVENWWDVLRNTFIPRIEFSFEYIFLITGVFGTTITPYMFFWQASEEVEEERQKHLITRLGTARINKNVMKSIRIDNAIGMALSEFTTWAIIIVGAAVLHQNGIFNILSADHAASAIEPLVDGFPNAGFLAKAIFASGIIGLGFLSIPVLSGSASYAVAEVFGWREGLDKKVKKAKGFYGIITISTLIGLFINFIGINTFEALVYAAVLNGLLSAPLLAIIAMTSSNKKIMGEFTGGKLSTTLLWITVIIMGLMGLGTIVTLLVDLI